MSASTAKPSKSDRTRAAILAAARERFAAQGYERTTVRDVAAKADIDPAMMIRYFGSKDGLFARAAVFDLRLPDMGVDRPGRARAGAGAALPRHLGGAGGQPGHGGAAALGRPRTRPPPSSCRRSSPGRCCRRCCGRRPTTPVARAGLVASQLLGLAFCRYVLELPPVVGAFPRADRAGRGGDQSSATWSAEPREPIERSWGAGARWRARYTRVEPGEDTAPMAKPATYGFWRGFFVGLVLAAAGALALAWVYPPRPLLAPEIGAGALEAPAAPGQPRGAAEPEAPRSDGACCRRRRPSRLIADAPGAGRRRAGRRGRPR